MAKYGLVGKDISYSFSKKFFSDKFEIEGLKDTYQNFDLCSIENFPGIFSECHNIKGLNVTIPYKESIIPFLDKIDKEAEKIGAVNTIKVDKNNRLKGYNTDYYGFAKSLANFLPIKNKTALILGTGGASKAVAYVLETMDFEYKFVSRTKTASNLTYKDLNNNIIADHFLIINTTPVGTFPDIRRFPTLPYQYIGKDHVLFDLIYNPQETEFLKLGYAQGARVSNGLKMLEFQALRSWEIWNK